LGSGTLNEPVLVGREHELEELRSYLDLAIKGRGNTVFLSGEAGAGKTRLVTEFLKTAKKSDVTVLTGWCLSNAAVPYFPFFEAFSHYFTGETELEPATGRPRELDAIAWLMGPDKSGKLGKQQTLSPQVWKDQTFAAVANTLSSIASQRPVVLFVDDVHWADSASLALIHYLARIVKSEKALVVAAFRSEELTIDAEGRPCPLVETLRLMRREDLYEEIRLATLDKKDVSTIAGNMLGGEVQPEFAEKLANESQGNPLFVVESLRMLHERDGLVLQQGNWRLARDELEVPDKIKDIILQRLSGLALNQRKTLEAAAVIGERFDAQLLASMIGSELSKTVETLDAIGRATSLVCCEGELYKFDHARSRDAVYGEISPVLRKVYHAKAAETLEGRRREGDLLSSDLFYHNSQAGNKEKALKYALAAGQDALARWSNAQAIEHFSYALANFPEGWSEQRRTALEGLGDAYAANSMYREAIKTFDKLASLETGRQRLRSIRKAMDAAYFIWGAADLLLEYAKKAEDLSVDDRLEMARILVNRGRAFGWAPSGNSNMDLADSDAALQVFEEEYSLADVATALWRSGVLCAILEGLEEKGIGKLLRSVSIFKELGDARKEVEAMYWTGTGFATCFLYSEAIHAYTSVLKNGEKLGMFAELSLTCNALANLDERDGKLVEALSYGLKSIEYGKKTDAMSGRLNSYGSLIRIYSKLGDFKQAKEYYEKTGTLPQEFRSHFLVVPDVSLTRGIRLAAEGQWKESNQTFEKFLESLKTIIVARPRWEFRARIDYAWALEKQERFEEAKVQLAEAQRIRREMEARFEHANVQASVMARKRVGVGEEFEMRVDCVNVGRKPAQLVEIKNALLDDLKVTSSSPWFIIQGDTIKMENGEVGAFQVNTVKLTLRCLKAGTHTLNPQAVYVDDLGETKTFNLRPVTITAIAPAPKERVAGKISSGTPDLDRLLFGGIPENFAIVLAAHPSDERALFIQEFLKAGTEAGETTFYVTADPESGKNLAEKYSSSFHLFLCNIRADTVIHDAPNVVKIKGVENLTDIDIALTKAFRSLNPSATGPKRVCIDLVSDVLLQHHAVNTRRWLGALLPTLKSKCFTVLVTVNPRMHPSEEYEAILGIFDGEISIYEKVTPRGMASFLRIKRMTGQKYLKDELLLTAE
jgi:KaiC/GvpD/RAD55 family RecA-like ATPase/tetratricopeptide (TPR) repeat protein